MSALKPLLTILSFLIGINAYAFLESPKVLPAGVNSLSLITGQLSSINQYYGSNGTLGTYSDQMSIEFDVDTLATFFPEVLELQALLNQFGSHDIGDKLYYGGLRLEVNPNISFQSLVFARGVTDQWTLGLGIPFARYNLNIAMKHVGSNIDGIIQELGGLNPDLDQVLDQLSKDASIAVQDYLTSKAISPNPVISVRSSGLSLGPVGKVKVAFELI